MAITLRNKETELMIRTLGRRWRLGPSAVIRRLAQKEVGQGETVSEGEFRRRMAAWDDIMELAPPRDPDLRWKDVEREMDNLFEGMDEAGQPAEGLQPQDVP
ncbi:hypothetical protein [Afifella aestuarii]|uniref:hypothetical protein n=1 Tax=Afifella aestuarii TaxID=1909496 RepID=UPI000FE38A0B|nr:hypothetical protein [Afifella aestuarii]